MRIALISVTNNGALLADRLAHKLDGDITVFQKAGRNSTNNDFVYSSLSMLVRDIFSKYDSLIFIMAAGIVVRVIAPFVSDKRFDPAIVVMDDQGQHVISLLSGHIGGANELTLKISKALGAKAVITTATDAADRPAADMLAAKLGLAIEPFSSLKTINAAITNNETVEFFAEFGSLGYKRYSIVASQLGIELKDITMLNNTHFSAAVLITDQPRRLGKPHIYLRQPNLAIGIGCRRGTSQAAIWQAVEAACIKIGRSLQSITMLGSTVLKSDEKGLLEFATKIAVPIKFFNNQELRSCIEINNLEVSRFVEKEIGVGNICEAAALLLGQTSNLLLTKTKYPGVTVAIAEAN
ncbi:Cobalt-precorrin-5A hydrolase [bioreactor metagenome]|uniref:Cobalt-precorrin-5A hydrolase n=1 Tax=bioreactor metagenome TaxID=1076179 RepID=A0A645BIJ0_9ZZZZ